MEIPSDPSLLDSFRTWFPQKPPQTGTINRSLTTNQILTHRRHIGDDEMEIKTGVRSAPE